MFLFIATLKESSSIKACCDALLPVVGSLLLAVTNTSLNLLVSDVLGTSSLILYTILTFTTLY